MAVARNSLHACVASAQLGCTRNALPLTEGWPSIVPASVLIALTAAQRDR